MRWNQHFLLRSKAVSHAQKLGLTLKATGLAAIYSAKSPYNTDGSIFKDPIKACG